MDITERKGRKGSDCCQKEEHESFETSSQTYKMGTFFLESILFLSMYLAHTRQGETNLEEYYKTLKKLGRHTQDIKQKYQISGIIAGMDAQVEVKPRQGPLVGDGTRMSRGNTARYREMESTFESLLMEWITKREDKLANTFAKDGKPARAKTDKLDFWESYIAVPNKWET